MQKCRWVHKLCHKWGSICIKHGAEYARKKCSKGGCTKYAQNAGVCIGHGAQKQAQAKRGRDFKSQGKHPSTNNDESTAFGSEFEMTTAAATQSIRDDCGSGAGQEGRGVPREVTILYQDTC